MIKNIELINNNDGTYDLLLKYDKDHGEFALDFDAPKMIKDGYKSISEFIKKQGKNITIKSVKVMVAGVIISSVAFSNLLPALAADKYNMGYLYTGTAQQQIEYVIRTGNSLNTVSPSYFDLNSDGSLKLNYVSSSLIAEMHSRGIKVVPFLSNHWVRATGINAVNNAELLSTQIADSIEKYNLDGVNIDIENVTHEQKDQYTKLVKLIRQKVPSNKEVSVAVAANPKNWQTGWHGSYDYKNLADNSDYLMLMTYDEHYEGGDPGPVASIQFVEDSIKYALTKTSKDKVVVGLALFGRVWSTDGGSIQGKGVGTSTINQIISTYNANVTYDNSSKSVKAEFEVKQGDKIYTVGGDVPLKPGKYVIWYENDQSYQEKLKLIQNYDLKGTGSWALGQEDPSLWDSYSMWLNGESENVVQQPPTVENMNSIDNEDGTFTIKLDNLQPASGSSITEVLMPTWSKPDQSDIVWYNATKVSGTNNWVVNADILNHKLSQGNYITHVYVKDNRGATNVVGGITSNNITMPQTSITTEYSADYSSFTVRATNPMFGRVSGSMLFPTWNSPNQSDIKWNQAIKLGHTYSYTTNINDHGSMSGSYYTHMYWTPQNAPQTFVGSTTSTIAVPTTEDIVTADNQDGTFTIKLQDLQPVGASSITEVLMPTWSKPDQSDIVWYNATKEPDSNDWVVNADILNHRLSQGDYTTHVYVKDSRGVTNFIGGANTANITIPQTSFTTQYNADHSSFTVTASNPMFSRADGNMLFPTWNAPDQSDIRWNQATRSGNSYSYTTSIIDHASRSGEYYTHIYLEPRNSPLTFFGATTSTVESAIAKDIAISDNKNGSFIIKLQDLRPVGTSSITEVLMPTWSKPDQSDIVWYKATKVSGTDDWVVNAKVLNNNDSYTVHVYARDSRGVFSIVGAAVSGDNTG